MWLYHVFSLSLRDVELILAERGVLVTHESIRHWCRKFGADFLTDVKHGTFIALACGAIGYFVVLRAQVFAGDALSHVAFTGALAALAAGISLLLGLYVSCLVVALGSQLVEAQSSLDVDRQFAGERLPATYGDIDVVRIKFKGARGAASLFYR